MAMRVDGPAGYAPTKTVVQILDRMRATGLPTPLTLDSLVRIGVSKSLAPRTLQTLRLLDLVDEQGSATEALEDLRRAPNAEFKSKLVALLKSVYSDVFAILEPSGASYEQVQDAFRGFTPAGQRDRMVTLFLGLLQYAEYGGDLPTAPRGVNAAVRTVRSTRGTGSSTSPQRSRDQQERPVPPSQTNPLLTQPNTGYSMTVQLGTAGILTLTVDFDPWRLTGSDREFFNGLVDRVNAYQAASQVTHTPDGGLPAEAAGDAPGEGD
jgi:hypothetical protein